MGAVSAADNNDTSTLETADDAIVGEDDVEEIEIQNASFSVPAKAKYNYGDTLEVSLLDSNGTGIVGKNICFTVNNKQANVRTDANGVAKLALKFKEGKNTINFTFNETGYNPVSGTKDVQIVYKTVKAKVHAGKYYAGIKRYLEVTFMASGKPLAGKQITFTLHKQTYTRKTNSKGVAAVTIYLPKGTYNLKYVYKGEPGFKGIKGYYKIPVVLSKNFYNTKTRTVLIDADGGFSKEFLNSIATKLRMAGWSVIVKGIGPGQHSKNFRLIWNGVYMPFYNGLCAATILEMTYSYYGGVIKSHHSVLAPSWYTRDWVSEKMSKFRMDITDFGYLKRAWDDNFSPASFKGLDNPAQFMKNNGIKYTIADNTYKIVEQFLYGGWNAYYRR